MVSDGFQTQKRGFWIPGKEQAERAWANAISVDGREEWTCKLCSKSILWTRWRCRKCYSNIPAGLQGEVQAGGRCKVRRMVYRLTNVEWRGRQKKLGVWKQRTRSSEQGFMPWKRRKECKEGLVFRQEKEGDRKMFWESLRKLKMRLRAAGSWTNRRKSCRRSNEMSTDCRLFPKRCRRVSWSHCSTSCKSGEREA